AAAVHHRAGATIFHAAAGGRFHVLGAAAGPHGVATHHRTVHSGHGSRRRGVVGHELLHRGFEGRDLLVAARGARELQLGLDVVPRGVPLLHTGLPRLDVLRAGGRHLPTVLRAGVRVEGGRLL